MIKKIGISYKIHVQYAPFCSKAFYVQSNFGFLQLLLSRSRDRLAQVVLLTSVCATVFLLLFTLAVTVCARLD